ncbi:hypothetical protein COF68_06025 [Bacillus toyonensis]|nr:hypothetical protein COF68_06025 [Bacillus toyonensis]
MSIIIEGNDKNRTWVQIVLSVLCCVFTLVRIHIQGYTMENNWIEYLLFLLFFMVSIVSIKSLQLDKKEG